MKVIVNRKQYENLIKESRGYSKTVEKWADYVTDELLHLILKQDTEEDVYLLTKLSLKLKGKDFYEELPVDSVILSVIIRESNGEDASIDMQYVPVWTQIVTDEDGKYNIYDAEIEIDMILPKDRKSINMDIIHYYFSSHLSHEFMHLYEWVNRGLETPKELKGCESVYMEGTIYGDAVERIGYLLYVALSYENNAFIQQVGTMLSKRNPENMQQFMDYLKETPVYHFVVEMLSYDPKTYLEEINTLDDDRKNHLKKIMMCFYSKDGSLPKIKEVNKFLDDINRKFKITGEYLKKKLLGLITEI